MKLLALASTVILSVSLVGCGSNYTLKKGGWSLLDKGEAGTCLVVHSDSDPEVVKVCILKPEPIKVPKSVLLKACPSVEPKGESDGAK